MYSILNYMKYSVHKNPFITPLVPGTMHTEEYNAVLLPEHVLHALINAAGTSEEKILNCTVRTVNYRNNRVIAGAL